MTKTELEDRVHELCIMENDNDYHVRFESDDQGTHLCVYIEDDISDDLLKKIQNLPAKMKIVVISTPPGFISIKFKN
tara:strand:- start:59 stop:289 length:231 start_codon:yes stop_codon:yes gene_type:complete